MIARCHNPHSKFYHRKTLDTRPCPNWHQSFIPQYDRTRICLHCVFHGEDGRRLWLLAHYINIITQETKTP